MAMKFWLMTVFSHVYQSYLNTLACGEMGLKTTYLNFQGRQPVLKANQRQQTSEPTEGEESLSQSSDAILLLS